MFILEESDCFEMEYERVGEYATQKEMQLAMMSKYKILRSYYQRVLDFGEWTVIDYGHHAHFFRYKEIK